MIIRAQDHNYRVQFHEQQSAASTLESQGYDKVCTGIYTPTEISFEEMYDSWQGPKTTALT